MTATERLRALLDEREVEWACVDTRNGEEQDNLTEWNVPNAGWVTAWEFGGHISYTWHMGEKPTPQQAIAATLGAGTCHDKGNIERFICSECGCRLDLQDDDWEPTMWLDDGTATVPRFCPNCGARVEGE